VLLPLRGARCRQGGLTVELDVLEVHPEDFSRELATCASCAESFTKTDGTVLRMLLPDPVTLMVRRGRGGLRRVWEGHSVHGVLHGGGPA
jgi:hypothetical protein